MNTHRQSCHCTHDVDTHFVDRSKTPPERAGCLAFGCDCRAYVDSNAPKPTAKKLTRPKHTTICRCFACKAYLVQEGCSTEPVEEKSPDTESSPPWSYQ